MLTLKNTSDNDRDVYFELVQEFPLRPIRNDEELAKASAMLDRLLECECLDVAVEEYLEVLEMLISKYEDEHHEIPPLPDHELLRQLMDAKGVSQKDVERATGICHSTISDVLRQKRILTREHIGCLSRYFHIPPETFSFS